MPHFESGNLKLYYELHGDGPETVVLMNGIMMSTRSWTAGPSGNPVLAELKKHYRILLHDFRGQGSSSQHEEPYDYELHARDLKALLDHLGIPRAHIAGTSYGAETGMTFALRFPEMTQSLAVITAVSHSDALLQAKIRTWIIAAEHAVKYGEKNDFLLSTVPLNFSNQFLATHPAHIAKLEESIARLPDAWFAAFQRLCQGFLKLNLTDELRRIKAPTLVVAATQDELKPVGFSSLIADRIPGARLEFVEAGHALVIEKPETLRDLLSDFLKQHPYR